MASVSRPTACGFVMPANSTWSSPTTKRATPSRLFSRGAPLRIVFSDDFLTLAWRKLLINAVANPITALTLQRQAVLRRPDIQHLCKAVLDEAAAVARADGARLAEDEAARTMATLF